MNKLRPSKLIYMRATPNQTRVLLTALLIIVYGQSCTRTDIGFGTIPENGYTNIVYIDTVGVKLSTVITDSFPSSTATSFLVGRYKDPYLGSVSAKCFFQLGIPATLPEIVSSAVFDSLSFIMRPNDYYYGDTSRTQTVYVNELVQTITPTYNSKLYNTSDIPVKSAPLGSRTLRISPAGFDSVSIRLDDTKGRELFAKLREQSSDIRLVSEFLNYFKGISLSVAAGDTTSLFGFDGVAGRMIMRVHYHITFPYPESRHIDFGSLANALAFNQVIPARSGTGLVSGTSGTTEISSSLTNGFAFMQPGSGLRLKMSFPGLRSILNDKSTIKLLKAELIVRPAYLSFDKNKYKLPSQLYLAQTDATNLTGDPVLDSTGENVEYASPVTDDIYGENNYYRLNVTAAINSMLLTAGAENAGFFVLQTGTITNVDRLIVNDLIHGKATQLLLSVLVVNK